MLEEELAAVALWAVGLVLVLVAVLTTIGRLFRYRYAGVFEPPWIRGGLALLAGFALISAALYLLGVREGLVIFWQYVLAATVAVLVIAIWRRSR